MKTMGKKGLVFVILGTALSCWLRALPAQAAYPDKPIQVFIPYGAGGDTDIAVRFLASVIPQFLGQSLVVINKPGASGAICFEYISKQLKPDGYMLMGAAIGSNSIVPAQNLKLPFQFDDLTFIARTQINPAILVVRADSPYKTLNDLLEYIRKNPKRVKFPTAGVQTMHHVGALVLMKSAKIPIDYVNAVHYDSGAEATFSLMRGDVDFCYNNTPTVIPQVKAGKLRGLLVPAKLKDLPDIPTSEQLGFPEVDIVGWRGICGPPGLPEAVVNFWTDKVKKTMEHQSWKKMVDDIGDLPAYLGPEDFKKFVTKEVKRYRDLFTELNLLIK